MRLPKDILIHYSIGHRGKSFYITPCGKSGGDYYVTKDMKQVTCKDCLSKNEKKWKRRG